MFLRPLVWSQTLAPSALQSTRIVSMSNVPRLSSHPCPLGPVLATLADQPRSKNVNVALQGPCVLTACPVWG
eukprot:417845-Pyramimonas_sp.AAC.1